MGATTNEFPLLNAVGLYVKDTAGNGELPPQSAPDLSTSHTCLS